MELPRHRLIRAQPERVLAKVAGRGSRIDFVGRECGQQHRDTGRSAVAGGGSVISDDPVGGGQDGTPPLLGRHEDQAAAHALGVPGM